MTTGHEDDGYGYQDEKRPSDDYPYSTDRRYFPQATTPVGRSSVDELAGNRGVPDPDGNPDSVESGEMAYLLMGRANASQVLTDRGPHLGALGASLADAHAATRIAMVQLREATRMARKRQRESQRDVRELEERYAHVPRERKLAPRLSLKLVVFTAIIAFAILDMWFFHKFVGLFWGIRQDSEGWQMWVMGPLLGALVALMVWVSGRLLGTRMWFLRASMHEEPDRPGGTGRDGRPLPWASRALRGGWWGLGRLTRRFALPLAAFALAVWCLTIVGVFGYFRSWSDEQIVGIDGEYVALLILSLGLGAMVLEMIVQNPYVDAVRSAESGNRTLRIRAARAAERAAEALSNLDAYADALHQHRDTAMSEARIEMDRAWSSAVLPSRHRSGRSGPSAPESSVLEDVGSGVHRLSRVPDDREIEAFFRTFTRVPLPPPALGPVEGATQALRKYDSEPFQREFDELTALSDTEGDGENGAGDDTSERTEAVG